MVQMVLILPLKCLDSSNNTDSRINITPKFFFKIPHVGQFSVTAQRSIRKLANRLCKPIDLRLVLTTFKVRNLFNVKDAVPEGLRTRVVYKFSCASCNACYVGETSRHFSTRVREHLLSDRSSNGFKHLQSSEFFVK